MKQQVKYSTRKQTSPVFLKKDDRTAVFPSFYRRKTGREKTGIAKNEDGLAKDSYCRFRFFALARYARPDETYSQFT